MAELKVASFFCQLDRYSDSVTKDRGSLSNASFGFGRKVAVSKFALVSEVTNGNFSLLIRIS